MVIKKTARWRVLTVAAAAAVVAPMVGSATRAVADQASHAGPATATPIKHLVVIFNENVSFDHYFATYPHAANPPGEPAFRAAPGTGGVNNLLAAHLLTNNPNFTN